MGFAKRLRLAAGAIPSLPLQTSQHGPDVKMETDDILTSCSNMSVSVGCQYEPEPRITGREIGCQTDITLRHKSVKTQLSKGTLEKKRSKACQAKVSTSTVGVSVDTIVMAVPRPCLASTLQKAYRRCDSRPCKQPRSDLADTPSFLEVEDETVTDPDDSQCLPSMTDIDDSTTEKVPVTPLQDMPKYIVYEDCLLDLFKVCPVCSRSCVVKTHRIGRPTFLSVDQRCQTCMYTRQWNSQPLIGSTPAGNIHLSTAVHLTGSSIVQTNKDVANPQSNPPPQDFTKPQTAPYEESCPGITFDVSEFTFATDEENNCSNEEGEEQEENNSSNEEGEEEEEEEIADSDSDWEMEDSDILESDGSDGRDFNLDSELPKSVRQLCPECGVFFFSCKPHTCEYKIKPLSCNICGKRCVDKSALKVHSKIHKESYEHPCKFCMAPFKTRLDKLAHERAHIPSAKPYGCPDCSMTFSKLPARNLHLKGHRGPKIFSCPHCALEFPARKCLNRHIVVHTGMKQFVCQFCSRSFNQPGHLKSHLRLHTGEKPFQCQHCDKSFNHNVSLKSHIMRYHKGASNSGPRGRTQEKMESPVLYPQAGIEEVNDKEMSTGDTEDTGEDVIDQDPKLKEEPKQFKKTYYRSMGRPKGRPKRSAATGETNSIPAVQEDALDPITAAEPSEEGHLRRASSKDIESDWSDRGSTSELAEEDEVEESKAVRKSKRKASQRPKTVDTAEEDFDSDSDFDPAEEAKKRRTSCLKSGNRRT